MRPILLSAAALICAAGIPAAAQSRAENAALLAWNDSLERLGDPSAIPAYAAVSHAAKGVAGDIRIALFQLRKSELTGDRGQRELALIRLDLTAAGHHGSPWPDYLSARAFFSMGAENAFVSSSAGLELGESHVEAAWRHLRYSLSIDPEFEPARALAIATLVPEGDRELRSDERTALNALMQRRDPEPDALLAAARALRTDRKYDAAIVLLDRAVERGGDESRLQLERARTLHALGDTAGAARAYWRGVEHMSAVGREMYRHDLAWIMAPDSLALFDAVANDSLESWLQRFWGQRDAAAANHPGERLQEHFRRWTFAFEHYRVALPWRRNQFTRVEYGFEGMDACIGNDSKLYELLAREQPAHPGDARHKEPLLDNRGLIYLHHGAPFRVVYGPGTPSIADTLDVNSFGTKPASPADLGVVNPEADFCIKIKVAEIGPNEAWLYFVDDQWRVLNFRGSCALGKSAATTLTSYLPISNATLGDWLARSNLLPEYHAAAMRFLSASLGREVTPMTCYDEAQSVVRESRADADVALHTDSDTPLIMRPWGAVIQAFALGSGAEQNGETLLSFAIPVDSLRMDVAGDGQRVFDVTARIVGYERQTGRMFSIDTVRRFAAPSRGGSRLHLTGWFEIALDPGDWQVAVRMNQGTDSIGAYALAAHVTVPDGKKLSISDIVTGSANGLPWTAPDGAAFPVNALGAWTPNGNAELYYEVRGLGRGEAYHAIIEVRGVDARSKDIVRVESTDQAAGPLTVVRKTLALNRLQPGTYQLIVSIDAGERHASRRQGILLVKP